MGKLKSLPGPRGCPLLGIILKLANNPFNYMVIVAQQYHRRLTSDYVLEPHYDIALRPRYGVPMLLTPRNNL